MNAQRADAFGSQETWDSRHLQVALATAHHHAQRGARRLHLSHADRDDLRQDILLALLRRCTHYDPGKGAWSTFVTLIARHAVADRARAERDACAPYFVELDLDDLPAGYSATQQDHVDPDLSLDLDRTANELPAQPKALLRLIRTSGEVADAQRASGQPCASFYRGIVDLRFWLLATGMRPSSGVPRRRAPAAG